MIEEYTPKTENVRLGYSYRPNLPEGERHHPPLLAEFDRWLEEHDREVAERAFDEGVHSTNNSVDAFCACECNPYRKETT